MPDNRMWRPEPGGPVGAGDVFGDHQVGDAVVVTYRMENIMNARVSVYFGAEESAWSDEYKEEPERWAPVMRISCETLDSDGEVVDEEWDEESSEGIFPLDYETPEKAIEVAMNEARKWQNTTWSRHNFFDRLPG